MKCKHDWLFSRNVQEHTELSKMRHDSALMAAGAGYLSAAKIMFLASDDAMKHGKRYVCANCDKTKEVF